jgi:hypothetical protein
VKNDGTVFVPVVVIVTVTEVTEEVTVTEVTAETEETDQNATMEDNDTIEATAGNEVTVTEVTEEVTVTEVTEEVTVTEVTEEVTANTEIAKEGREIIIENDHNEATDFPHLNVSINLFINCLSYEYVVSISIINLSLCLHLR